MVVINTIVIHEDSIKLFYGEDIIRDFTFCFDNIPKKKVLLKLIGFYGRADPYFTHYFIGEWYENLNIEISEETQHILELLAPINVLGCGEVRSLVFRYSDGKISREEFVKNFVAWCMVRELLK